MNIVPARAFKKLPRYWANVAVFVAMTGLQALAAVLSIQLLSTVRAYVTGESLYSKGQMNAQFHLLDYAAYHREEDFQSFEKALLIPLGDRQARVALQRPSPDIAAARKGLLQAGNSPEDVDNAVRVFLWFQGMPFLSRSINTWTAGDEVVEEMRDLVTRARERILANDPGAPAVTLMRTQAPILNAKLTQLEIDFARQLGDASRTVQHIVLGLNLLIALILTSTGVAFVRRSYTVQEAVQAEIAASEAKTEFLSRMSHELRTPLNAVIGFAQILRMDSADPLSKQQRDRIGHIEVAGEHLLALVNEVLDLSRIESGDMAMPLDEVPLGEVVDEAVTMVSPLVTQAGVEVVVLPQGKNRAPPRDPHAKTAATGGREVWVSANRVRVRQVVVNLVTNAIKYNRPGGNVLITWEESDGICELKVVDTGEGIPPEKLSSLFEPFNRLGAEHTRVEGTGIGLVLSRQLAEMMGGTLSVDSKFGFGTTATLRLPAGSASAPAQPGEPRLPATTGEGRHKRFNVLYAEDNEVNAELVRQLMTFRPSVTLRVADSGGAAIEMASFDPPDLLLVDMNLGDMTGMDLAQTLRSDRAMRDVRFVALSADALPEQIEAAMQNGFGHYLTKPIKFDELLSMIDAYSEAA